MKIIICSLEGKQVKTLVDEELFPGYYPYKWGGKSNSGNQQSSGIYFCSLLWKDEIMDTK
ncbi:MAG: hypothetical protein VX600_02665 [Candidatus Neomarinimicrobiota bacterium]|nr:hypothetical protein [Candidatus Neomarinimicrobiota bacterium]MEE2765377.1 hypothetical protein [Candidatus Neomarinimicrobiota bacterium]